jgi:superfamily II DNA or RNA helicase
MSRTYNLEYLKNLGFRDPSKFRYDGKTWSAWYYAKFDKYLIKNRTDNTKSTTIATWIKTIYNGYTPEPTPNSLSNSLDYNDYKSCLRDEPLDEKFLNLLEIKLFQESYKSHPNISTFDFSLCNNTFHLNKMYGKFHILFFDNGEQFYGKFKFDSNSGWLNIKGTKNLGAFLKSEKSSRTLILCEGLKDGINANIAFPTADIFVTDSKTIPFKFIDHDLNPKQYQKIILAVDRDVTKEEQSNLLYDLNASFYKKVFSLDWSKIEVPIKDLSNWIASLDFTLAKLKKNGLSSLKKILLTQNFNEVYIEQRIKELEQNSKWAIETKNLNLIRRVIKTKNILGADISKEAEFLIKKESRAKNETIINLNENKRLSDFSNELISNINFHNKTLLNAPTGTGKSHLVKKIFPNHYQNIITISPLRMVTDEMSEQSIFVNVNSIEEIDNRFISMTTDIFENLSTKFFDIFLQRIQQSKIIVFDEQHIYMDSKNFREKVVKVYEYLLYRYEGKVLFMSGTPVIPQDIQLNIITAKVPKISKSIINYSKNPFLDESEMMEHIKEQTADGSVMVYCNSKTRVEEVNALLIKNGIDCFSMTSIEMKENDKIIKEKRIKSGNYAYISTTKATTGITIKNLKGIYQYGTIYSSNTFIQLLGRLRNGGFYIYIRPKFESRREHFLQNQIIGMVKGFQKLEVTKLSESFDKKPFQEWLSSRFTLPFYQNDLKGFLKVFQEPLRIIEANGLGQLTQERDDYIFRGLGVKKVEEVFESTDNISFKKYIDRVIMDWINNNSVEMLNDIYNLSFLINDATIRSKIKGVELITQKDKELKRERRKEVTTQNREFYKELEGKFQGCLAISTLKKGFSVGELSRLNEISIDMEKLKSIVKNIDKIVFLQTQLISKDKIFEITERIINEKGFCLVKELDSELQKEYIISARTKNVYSQFLIDLFKNRFFDDSKLQYDERKEIKGKRYRNTITVMEMRV